MIRMALLKVPAIGAAAAAAVGVMSGGMMRPDASQFERPAQTLITENPVQIYGQPDVWTGSGPVPSYVVGTDALQPAAYAMPAAYQEPLPAPAPLSVEDELQPTAVDRHADARPAPDDRAGAIRDAQVTSPAITAPQPTLPTVFPSEGGGVTSGLTHASAILTTQQPGAIKARKPLATLDGILNRMAADDARASDRVAGRY